MKVYHKEKGIETLQKGIASYWKYHLSYMQILKIYIKAFFNMSICYTYYIYHLSCIMNVIYIQIKFYNILQTVVQLQIGIYQIRNWLSKKNIWQISLYPNSTLGRIRFCFKKRGFCFVLTKIPGSKFKSTKLILNLSWSDYTIRTTRRPAQSSPISPSGISGLGCPGIQ